MKSNKITHLLAVILLLAAACGGAQTAVTPTPPFPIPTLPPDLPIFFPRYNFVNGEWVSMTGQIRGKLREENGCIRIEEYLVIWPPHYGADSENDQIRILDADGHTLALVGEEVHMGGGPGAVGSIWMDEQLAQTIPPECCQYAAYNVPGSCTNNAPPIRTNNAPLIRTHDVPPRLGLRLALD